MTTPTVRFRIDFSRNVAVGPGKISLLEHIGRSGSLSQAARELKMSYRYAWLLLDSLNHSFREPVAVTSTGGRKGGGSSLTPFGRALIRAFRGFEKALKVQSKRHFRAFSRIARTDSAPRRRLPIQRLSAR